jgi:1,4-dihydroxy-2-naphthoate octaprenyltransferase
LVVRFGRRFANWQYATLVAVSHAAPLAMVLVLHTPPTVLLSLATAPWGVQLARRVARAEGRALNPLLPATAGLLLVQSALLALGILLAGRTP